jgi:ribosomal protection tetracycline resistance protein
MHVLNLGILAHVDAGKTSLTERLLYAAGVVDEIGSVDDGSTQTDSLDLERRRGITIKSAVVSFAVGDVTVNLIDTPGHPDFIAEVERALSVLDGAVLVISAVEGVQAQTRVLMRTLQRLRIPTLIFVNKIDRGGADCERVLRTIAEKLTPAVLAMGQVVDAGTRSAYVVPHGDGDAEFATALADRLSEHDDGIVAAIVNGDRLSVDRLTVELAAQTGQALVHPVFFGSAITGAGVDALACGLTDLLPRAAGDVDAPLAGTVFKVERGPAGDRVAYVRMYDGTLRTRDRLQLGAGERKVTDIHVMQQGTAVQAPSVGAGRIAKVWGLGDVRIGDPIGVPLRTSREHLFAPPTLETVLLPRNAADRPALHVALTQLAEQDPLINVRQDDVRQELYLSLYGEVQKEVIQETLASEYGVDVGFRETTPICIEHVVGVGSAVQRIGKGRTPEQPFLATVGLRVEPGPEGSGVTFGLDVELGAMPLSLFNAVEDAVHRTLRQGLHGWQVTDVAVAMTHCGYWPRQSHMHGTFDKSMSSTAGDFRDQTPLVLMQALQRAGTVVHEPMHRYELEIPVDALGAMLPVLAQLDAAPQETTARGSSYLLVGEIPAARVHDLQRQLPALTRGDGVLEHAFAAYRPVRGSTPARPRTDHNPLNRKEYLLHVVRRV